MVYGISLQFYTEYGICVSLNECIGMQHQGVFKKSVSVVFSFSICQPFHQKQKHIL